MKIIIVSIDSLRADSLGCYGYSRNTSPNIDVLAADGAIFTNAYTPAHWTNPSYFSLITALLPSVHGVVRHYHGLMDGVPTLPQTLARKGYATILFSNYFTLLDEKRFGRHFQQQVYFDIDRDAGKMKEKLISLGDQDFFSLIHVGNYVHEPYCAPRDLVREFWPGEFSTKKAVRCMTEEMKLTDESMRDVLRKINLRRTPLSGDEVEYLKACYDAGIKYVDRWVGEFFTLIKSMYGDEYIFLVTADHGQGFFEHGFFGHGLNLHQELVRIPLLFHAGVPARQEIDSCVQLIDIFPTLMDILGLETPSDIDGHSFYGCLEGEESVDRPIISEGFPFVACIRNHKKLIISFYHLMPWKTKLVTFFHLIKNHNMRKVLLHLYSLFKTSFYDLRRDPEEKKNRSRKDRSEVKELIVFLRRWYRECGSRMLGVTTEKIEEERTINQLKSLGYL